MSRSPVELRETNSMGWGVFAAKEIKAGSIITQHLADPFTEAEWENIKQCKFGPYVFMDRGAYAEGKKSGFIAWGIITKINHNDDYNAQVETTMENGHLEAILRATRTIHAGEQVFIEYTNRDDPELYPWYGA